MTRVQKTFIQVIVALVILVLVYSLPRMGKNKSRTKAEKTCDEIMQLDTNKVQDLNYVHNKYNLLMRNGGYSLDCLKQLGACLIEVDTGLVVYKKTGVTYKTISEKRFPFTVKYRLWRIDPEKYQCRVIYK